MSLLLSVFSLPGAPRCCEGESRSRLPCWSPLATRSSQVLCPALQAELVTSEAEHTSSREGNGRKAYVLPAGLWEERLWLLM